MASRTEAKQVTVPAGTALAAPQVTVLPFQDGQVERIEIRIPPGPSGLVGFQVRYSGQRIIPFRDDVWIIADDEPLDWPLTDQPTGGAWSVAAYNTDIYDHTLYFRFHLSEITGAVVTPVTIVPVDQLAPAEDVVTPNLTPAPAGEQMPVEDLTLAEVPG